MWPCSWSTDFQKHSMCLYSYIHLICQWIFQVFWFSVERKKKSTPVKFLWVIDLIVLTLGVCVGTQIILLNRLVHILHTCSTFTVYTETSNFSGLTIQVVTDVLKHVKHRSIWFFFFSLPFQVYLELFLEISSPVLLSETG